MYFQEFLTPYGGKRSAVWAGRFDIFQTRPNIISIALALCYFGATILKSFPEAGLDHFTFLYHNYYSSPFRNKNTAAKSLRCKAFTMLIYIKIDRPLPWWSVNLSWRRWRDLNPRTPCGAYRISNPDPSATWVHLHCAVRRRSYTRRSLPWCFNRTENAVCAESTACSPF